MRSSIQSSFGKILRQHRQRKQLSQEKLAELANLDRTYISQIERGLKSPSIATVIALAKALDTRAHLLIFEVECELEKIPAQER